MTDTTTLAPCPHLEPCPWCGCALYTIWRRANPRASCKTEGCFGKKMAVVNLDDPSDVAAWNRRATVAVPAGIYPAASKSHGAWDGIEDVLDMPDGTEIFTAAQVQAMLAAGIAPGWQAVPVEPTTKMREQGGTECGTGMLGSPEEAARVYRAMLAAAPSAPRKQESIMALHEQIEALARKHGATSYRNRADTQNPAYGFTPAALLNLIAEVTGELRKQDEALIRKLAEALESAGVTCASFHHKKADRHEAHMDCQPMQRFNSAIAAARLRLEGKP